MAEIASLFVKVEAETKEAVKSLNTFSTKMKNVGKTLTNLGTKMTIGLTTPLVLAGKQMFQTSADFAESVNKVEVAFGDAQDEIKQFAKTTLREFGIAEGTALEMASLFGDMSTAMGLTTSEASVMSKGMVSLAGDLASFKNVQLDVAQTALAGIFTGETESLKRLGIVMTEANLEMFALSKGIETNIKDMTQAEKVQLRYAYVTEMSKNAVGDFSRTSESASNQTRTLGENLKELTKELGDELLPLIVPFIKEANNMVDAFKAMEPEAKSLFVQLGIGIAVVGPLLMLLGGLATAVSALATTAGQIVLVFMGTFAIAWYVYDSIEKAMNGIPDLLTQAILKITIAANKVGRELVQAIGDGIKSAWNGLVNMVMDLINGLLDKFKINFNFDFLRNALSFNTPKNELGTGNLGIAGVPRTPAPTLKSQGMPSPTIIVNSPTALNPQQVARATTQSLRNFALEYQ